MSNELPVVLSGGLVGEDWHRKVDEFELALCAHPNVIDLPVEHRFTPGLYIRTLRAQAGVGATTFIHKQTHPFVVTKGVVLVGTDEGKLVEVRAPHFGITEAGTRRVCLVVEDAEWTTFHPIPEGMTDIDEIERLLYEFRTLEDGTNVRDRFKDALAAKAIADSGTKEIQR